MNGIDEPNATSMLNMKERKNVNGNEKKKSPTETLAEEVKKLALTAQAHQRHIAHLQDSMIRINSNMIAHMNNVEKLVTKTQELQSEINQHEHRLDFIESQEAQYVDRPQPLD